MACSFKISPAYAAAEVYHGEELEACRSGGEVSDCESEAGKEITSGEIAARTHRELHRNNRLKAQGNAEVCKDNGQRRNCNG